MAISWLTLAQTVLTGSAATIYTSPVGTQTSVHTAQLWNPTGAPVVVDIFVLPVSGSAADGTHVDRITVPATSAATSYGLINQKMSTGQALSALGNGVTITVSGAQSV